MLRKLILPFVGLFLVPSVLLSQSDGAVTRLQREHRAVFTEQDNDSPTPFRFFQFPEADRPDLAGVSVEEKAEAFWREYGTAFGVYDPDEVELTRSHADQYGNYHLFFGQRFWGIPVFGAEVGLHFDRRLGLRAVGGSFMTSPAAINEETALFSAPPVDGITTTQAQTAASNWLTKHHPGLRWAPLQAEGDYLYLESLLGGRTDDGYRSYAFRAREADGIREFLLFVDRAGGRVISALPYHCEAMDREVYRNNTAPANLVWSEGDAFPGSLNDLERTLVTATENSYALFFRTFGRDSYDDGGGTLLNILDSDVYEPEDCPNAQAGSDRTHYCNGAVADDVVAHEWAHVYTRAMNGLIYRFESGALNEAYSDIIGEVVDLLTEAPGDVDEGNTRTNVEESNTRWRIAEDATGFSSPIRDMYAPNDKNHPASMTDPMFQCLDGDTDNGGVHRNSGVLNRFFSLLVDGGTLNGVTVVGIGLTRATHLIYETFANYVSPVTDYNALSVMLEAAAADLVNQELTALQIVNVVAPSSGETFRQNHYRAVLSAIDAVEMTMTSGCEVDPALAPAAPDLCGTLTGVNLFSEDWEEGMDGWLATFNAVNPATWEPKNWEPEDQLPDFRPGNGIAAPNPYVGDCATDLENGWVQLKSPAITVPEGVTDLRLAFDHYFSIEDGWDGGMVYLDINGGGPRQIENSAFLFNGYSRAMETGRSGNDNPLVGFDDPTYAFTGADGNSTTGSWGQSQVDLTAAGVEAGDEINLSFVLSYDGCNGWLGWYLDDISVSYCVESVLPVVYDYFRADAKDRSIALEWATIAEEHHAGFTVERRAEGERDFRDLGWVAGGGERARVYRYIDATARPGRTYFYRLRQRDYDGSEAYSAIRSARLEAVTAGAGAFPNPVVTGSFTLVRGRPETAPVFLYTTNGKRVRSWPAVMSGERLSLLGLPTGLYYLRWENDVIRLFVEGK